MPKRSRRSKRAKRSRRSKRSPRFRSVKPESGIFRREYPRLGYGWSEGVTGDEGNERSDSPGAGTFRPAHAQHRSVQPGDMPNQRVLTPRTTLNNVEQKCVEKYIKGNGSCGGVVVNFNKSTGKGTYKKGEIMQEIPFTYPF